MVEAEIDAEADECDEIEDDDREAHEERRAATLGGQLEMMGVGSHVDDCVLW